MNAIELFHADGKPAKIFYCEKCRIVKRTKEEADQCCAPVKCATCGNEGVRQFHTICDACEEKKRAAREEERFTSAEKITEWDGPIYSDGYGFNEGYFANVEALEDWLSSRDVDDDNTRPKYVWTCTKNQFCQLDYDRIIENATQEAYEDWDEGNIYGEQELKSAIAVFNEANKNHVSWEPNYKVALLLTTDK